MVTGSTKNMCLIDPVTLWATELGASGGPLKNRAECTSEMSSQCWTLEHLPTLVHHRLRVFSGTVTASSHPNCVSGLPWKKQPWEKLWEKSWGIKAERCGELRGGVLAACMVLSTQLKWNQWWAEAHGAEHKKCFTFYWLLDGCILSPAMDWTLWQAQDTEWGTKVHGPTSHET